jgi:hypothetical protein
MINTDRAGLLGGAHRLSILDDADRYISLKTRE